MKINPSFSSIIYSYRQSALSKRSTSRRLVAWVEDHRLRTGPAKAIVFILPTRGCSWALSRSGGCSICGYLYDNPQKPDFSEMLSDFSSKLSSLIDPSLSYSIKLFTSGSILDSLEVPKQVLISILHELQPYSSSIKELVLESRPSYVTEEKLTLLRDHFDIAKVEIAIGLESANNAILRDSINKGFFWEDFERATKRVFSFGAKIKAYLLFKPPFVSEFDSILDIFNSVKQVVSLGVDTVSINAINIQRGTYLSSLFEKNFYRPPYLWSLVHICQELSTLYPNLRIICDPVAGGKKRGAHNCGSCDSAIVQALKDFTLSQDPSILQDLPSCPCKLEWKSYLLHSKLNNNDFFSLSF
ncbi:MAG: archaeosine biosynthesis radical SAM protein RaSEA [Candidatus Heimdallarchaeum endolithica]|uniref:Archaeosine biosynthesis radical SAM protein RaSEA n=1 Tax=Candidatus Heimdallarchaeum endolithica TaxID=2876572 RepID=A0A9Y1BPP0_9ARCH|nr:MAG: archaeosine biosynthesis radical SAM protein RaSEA [Candidatus Heimdallarchaeum endolithica]